MEHRLAQSQFYQPDTRIRRPPDLAQFQHAVSANRSTRVQGWFQSYLNASSFPFFSSHELKAMKLLDLTETVQRYEVQPASITYQIDGRSASYTPDALVHPYIGLSFYIEVKPRDALLDPLLANKLVVIGAELKRRNTPLKIVTDAYLAMEPRHSNIRSLQAYRPVTPDAEFAYCIDTFLARAKTATIGAVARLASNISAGRETVYSLILRRHLATDLRSVLSDDSIIRHSRGQ